MPLEFDWVDAFADRPFAGNGCAVVLNAADLPDDVCTAVVRETGLVECTFVGPSDRADFKVRYFIASREIPFAGHPTIATAAALIDRGLIQGETAAFETGAGRVDLRIADDGRAAPVITMTQQRPEFGPTFPTDLVAAVGGVRPEDIAVPPRLVSTGLPFCITVLHDHDTLARVRLDVPALERFQAALTSDLADAIQPFWVAPGGATEAGDTFARLLMPPPSPAEDPFTGSATGAMAAFLWAEGLMAEPRFTAEQGHWLGRPGSAQVERIGPADDIQGVRVAGQGYVLMRGYLNL